MSLKNLMEDKQLDFNQPLLSVRRFSTTAGSEKDVKRKTDHSLPGVPLLPSYRSELKSGPVRNPGTVPFVWEQTPGRPKDESKSLTLLPIIPKLPPGRIMEAKQQNADKGSEDSSLNWCEEGKVPSSSLNGSSLEDNLKKFEISKNAVEEGESSDSEDGDEAYLDALDTLSGSESVFLNCSLSGMSGFDVPEGKLCQTFSTDPQTRDFMMGRFLPAAKAMASETPQYSSRKQQPVVKEKPRELRKIISGAKPRSPLYRSRPNILPNYVEDTTKDEESDNEDDDYEEPGNLSTKVCGLIPSFCLKSSLSLLNPVPSMSVRTRVPMSAATRAQGRSPSCGSSQETKNERVKVATHEKKSIVDPQKTELRKYINVVRNKYNQVPHPSSYQKLDGSSLYRRLQGNGISTKCNELPQSRFFEQKGFLGTSKEAEIDEINSFITPKRSFQELLADQSTKTEIGSSSPMTEKTLYVDSVHKMVSPKLNALSSDSKGLPNSMDSDLEIVTKNRGLEETPLVDSLLKNAKNSNINNAEAILNPKRSNPVDSSLQSFSGKSDHETGMEILKGFDRDQNLCQESITSANKKFASNRGLDYEDHHDQELTKVEKIENSQAIDSQLPLPPPLPKSPSDSWLCRTLPSMSTRNLSSRSYLGSRLNSQPYVDPKWETIVKTTHHHLQLAEVKLILLCFIFMFIGVRTELNSQILSFSFRK
ncbi:hypothetical protein U1Q18_001718 [Sarracenia purpurea var. burkii]